MELVEPSGEDPLASLEDRIQRAVELIPRLRRERDAAAKEREEAEREAEEARSKLDDLKAELQSLRQDREQVRARIEKLLGTMDVLGAG